MNNTSPDLRRVSSVHFWLAGIFTGYAALVTLFAANVPRWNAPDEPAHFNYVRQIADRFELPVLTAGDYDYSYLEQLKAARFPPDRPVDSLRYEGHQPPLYYLLAAAALRAAPLGPASGLLAVRLFSALVGLLVLVVAFATVRRLAPNDHFLALGVTALLAFTPMHLAVNAAAGNDPLAELVLALILFESVGIFQKARNEGRSAVDWAHVRLGLVVGLALITKMTVYAGVPLAAVAVVAACRDELRLAARRLGLVAAIALAISVWWFWRGIVVYGWTDPFGLRRHAMVVAGQPVTSQMDLAGLLDFSATMFRSFWGQFGWMGVLLDERVYQLLALYCLAGVLGLALSLLPAGLSRRDRLPRPAMLLLVLVVLLVTAATIFYSATSFYQPQGRYMFPAFISIAVGLMAGIRRLVAPAYVGVVTAGFVAGLVALDLASLYLYILPSLGT